MFGDPHIPWPLIYLGTEVFFFHLYLPISFCSDGYRKLGPGLEMGLEVAGLSIWPLQIYCLLALGIRWVKQKSTKNMPHGLTFVQDVQRALHGFLGLFLRCLNMGMLYRDRPYQQICWKLGRDETCRRVSHGTRSNQQSLVFLPSALSMTLWLSTHICPMSTKFPYSNELRFLSMPWVFIWRFRYRKNTASSAWS